MINREKQRNKKILKHKQRMMLRQIRHEIIQESEEMQHRRELLAHDKKQSDKLAKLHKYHQESREKAHIKSRKGLSDDFIKDRELEKVEEGLSDRISETDVSEFTENPDSEITYVNII